MIHQTDLEKAIEYRDRMKELQTFRKGVEDWRGDIECTFGSYKVRVSHGSSAVEFAALLDAEERMLRNTLEIWGVRLDDC